MDIAIDLLDPVREILRLIENLTKKPFKFVRKDDLETYAAVRIARQHMPEHILVYKPEKDEVVNHLIAHECGHIKRLFEVPPEKRFTVATTDEHKRRGMSIFENELVSLSSKIDMDTLAKTANLWFSGLVRQVTNQPVDLMIEKWLYQEYPSLRRLQILSLSSQNDLALKTLDKKYKQFAPHFVYKSSIMMNIAYTNSLSRIVRVKFIREWKKAEFYTESLEIANLLDIEKGWPSENDRDMVNLWAKRLNLADWFNWHPFEDVPLKYYDVMQ